MKVKEYIIKVDEEKADITGGMRLIDRPQELVRCKDCKHYDKDHHWADPYGGYYIADRCDELGKIVKSDWFCADGVKKDD